MTIPPRLSLDQLPAATTIDTSSTTDNLLLLRQGNIDKKMSAFLLNGLNSDGDVHGPSSATDNALARFDTTTGKLIQNSNATLDDAGNLNLGIALALTSGGTGQTSFAQGDILYASAINTLSKLPIGQESDILSILSGVPAWKSGSGGDGILTLNSILPDVSRDFEISSSDNTVTLTPLANGLDLSVSGSQPKIAFSAHSSTNNFGCTGDGTIWLITPDLVTQTGTDYNLVNGTFTCSVAGYYQFNANIGLIGLDNTNTNLRAFLTYTNLETSISQNFFFANLPALSITDSTTVGVVTGSMQLPMSVGDTVAMYVNVQGVSKNVGTLGVNGAEIYCRLSGSN